MYGKNKRTSSKRTQTIEITDFRKKESLHHRKMLKTTSTGETVLNFVQIII
jgi:hypothetical protein